MRKCDCTRECASVIIRAPVNNSKFSNRLQASFYPGSKIWYSAILPRLDKDHNRTKEINQAVHKYCKTFETTILQFVDFSIDFYQNAKKNGALSDVKKALYRYSEGHTDDTVHLGVEGNKVLKDLFENLIEHNDREREGFFTKLTPKFQIKLFCN